MDKSLKNLSYKEIIYLKNYIRTLNKKFLNQSYLDVYFEKLCHKNFIEICNSLKFMTQKDDLITDDEPINLNIFDKSLSLKLSPEYETTEKNNYINLMTNLIFFKFGFKIRFKNLTVKHFEEYFDLTVNNYEILEKHFSRLKEITKYFSGLQLQEIEVDIISDKLFIINNLDNEFKTWLGIPISKNNNKKFNQMMLDIWCYVETPKQIL